MKQNLYRQNIYKYTYKSTEAKKEHIINHFLNDNYPAVTVYVDSCIEIASVAKPIDNNSFLVVFTTPTNCVVSVTGGWSE